MIPELSSLARRVLGQDIAGRSLYVEPDDTYIVSYPRSGNTWTRFLIANLLHPEQPVTFENIEQIVPDMHADSRRHMQKVSRPRFIKSHEYFDPRYPKVIYIVRDPRDVAISGYHFHRKQRQIEENYPLDAYIRRFIAGDVFSVYASWGQNVASWLFTRNLEATANGSPGLFGCWGDHVAAWLSMGKESGQFLLLQYEGMLENPERELAKVAGFLRLEAPPERLSQAVERSSADALRRLEERQSERWVLTKNTRQDIPFVRSAKAGDWKTSLPAELVTEIERAWGPLMEMLGYELSSRTQTRLAPAGAERGHPAGNHP